MIVKDLLRKLKTSFENKNAKTAIKIFFSKTESVALVNK
jgi:hypothetical protein